MRQGPRQVHAECCLGDEVDQPQGKQQGQRQMHAVELANPIEQQCPGVEEQFDFERPIDTVDVRNPEQAMDHQQVERSGAQADSLAGQRQGVHENERQDDGCPIRREQAAKAGYDEVHRPADAVQGHEDDEPTDHEEEIFAVVAPRQANSGWRDMAEQPIVLGRVVE